MLAPEGVAQVSVNWYALLAPVLGWIGAGLLAYRLADLVLRPRPHGRWHALLRPLAGELAPTVAATMGRQRRLLARAPSRSSRSPPPSPARPRSSTPPTSSRPKPTRG